MNNKHLFARIFGFIILIMTFFRQYKTKITPQMSHKDLTDLTYGGCIGEHLSRQTGRLSRNP